MNQLNIRAEFPPKLIKPLFTDSRYRVFVGGRAGCKSWSIARALLIQGLDKPLRVCCVREFMSSIEDSVWKLLSNQIVALGLEDFYTVEKSSIYGKNGTEFRFAGIRNNASAIRSFEGINVAWVEEAANVSKNSWEILIPTVREKGSQIIISFNPVLESDETYKRFIINTPPRCIVTKINYNENPWFGDELREEMEYLKNSDYDAYLNIWEGHPKVFLDNAIYARELRQATVENRITKVPYDPLAPVHTFWDLGWADSCSIICAQIVGLEFRIIDYIQDSQKTVNDYVKLLQAKEYIYGTDYLPFDGTSKQMGTGRSIEEIMRGHGRKVQIVPRLSIADGINATRTVFDRMWFDQEHCTDLIQCLRKYRYDTTGLKPVPVHDENSHGADAFRYMAISLKAPKQAAKTYKFDVVPKVSGWMS